MGRPCTKCPGTKVESCCGNRNLKVACVLIGVFKLLAFISGICVTVSVMGGATGNTESEKQLAQHSTAQLLVTLAMLIAQLFLTATLIAGVLKARRNYVMIYWAANCVLVVLILVSLFAQPPGVGQFVVTLFYILLDIYFQIVIRSYYLEMSGAATGNAEAQPGPTVGSKY